MKFTLDGNDYVVRWRHTNVDKQHEKPVVVAKVEDLRRRKRGGQTECSIRRVVKYLTVAPGEMSRQEVEIANGVAECSRRDQFSRKTGRKIALQRAVESLVKRGSLYMAGCVMAKLAVSVETGDPIISVTIPIEFSQTGGVKLASLTPEGQGKLRLGQPVVG